MTMFPGAASALPMQAFPVAVVGAGNMGGGHG